MEPTTDTPPSEPLTDEAILAQAAQGNRIDYGVLVDLTKSNSTTVQNPTNSS